MPKIRLLFVRHGERARTKPDAEDPLSKKGAPAVAELGNQLKQLGIDSRAVLTSRHEHARQTAEALAVKPTQIDALTPLLPEPTGFFGKLRELLLGLPERSDPNFTVAKIVEEVEKVAGPLPALSKTDDPENENVKKEEMPRCVVLVGHETRLSQLIAMMTGTRVRQLEALHVVCVEADSTAELHRGTAKVAWRFPVEAHTEPDFRQKLATKINVTTFTAGFTFTALMHVVMNTPAPSNADLFHDPTAAVWLPVAAILCLTTAVGLFLITAYTYDRLNMPVGFWGAGESTFSSRLHRLAGDHCSWLLKFWGGLWNRCPRVVGYSTIQLNKHGLIYCHMTRAWNWLFTPGVLFATMGFLLIVASKSGEWVAGGCGLIAAVVACVYWRTKPGTGAD